MHKILLVLLFVANTAIAQNLTKYVNPFVGTQNMGHTFPGASTPFGMVQLSPDTDTIYFSYGDGYNKDIYRYCAGYQYDDPTIVGFSHTHFSGTGHSDLGDILIMPTIGDIQLYAGSAENPKNGYRSKFSHENEKASPGYYSVLLEDDNIFAELTTSDRVGFHKYSFPSNNGNIILDLVHGIYNYDGKNVWTSLRVENDTLITGCKQTRGWARERTVYFAITLSEPISEYGYTDEKPTKYNGFYRKFNLNKNFPEICGNDIKCYFKFNQLNNKKLKIKVALSPVSIQGAVNNLIKEIPKWNFQEIVAQTQQKWEKELSKIKIETTEEDKYIFYTALYHTMLSPTLYMDIDGQYRGIDHQNHKAENYTNFSTFSLWDTFRTLHPLFTITQTARTSDFVNSMLKHQEQSVHKMLPIWSHHGNENWCMIGYHSTSVIADAIMKDIKGFDYEKALQACISTSNCKYFDGIGDYIKYGFVTADNNSDAASKTLEYAYDDFCIAQIAKKLGKESIANEYFRRSESFKNIFDKETGFMRAKKKDNTFQENFNALQTHSQGFIEGNAWNYSLFVPHDVDGLISLIGGKKKFIAYLDSIFTMQLDKEHYTDTEDITIDGILGNYIHGNEPSHHIPYLYALAGKPEKTREIVKEILSTFYKNTPNGLCGNDDCGQMSAWYIMSALGFYPVCPANNEYVIGEPIVDNAEIRLENGKVFKIETVNKNKKNKVRRVLLNGNELKSPVIQHSDIANGGKLTFVYK